MSSLKRLLAITGMSLLVASCDASIAFADSSHARIVRISLVQGDVRFARDVKGDPLNDSRSGWEGAVLNLPIRQGFVLATDAGRAEVEFENGAMAFLAENTVLEFYDLSSEDGGFTTRLILRQGSVEFYVHPGRGDYFSVTGGDFSVQAETRATFRMNNFDDGSNVEVLQGRLTALIDGKNKSLEKNQSLSLRAGEPDSLAVERIPPSDDFDQWVSGRIETSSAATNAGLQYSDSYNAYNYTSGFGDLYTFGAWFPVAGYGRCWRPYGVGFGWAPFDFGWWYYDPFFGWTFIGGQPWGWLPYHYGGWVFQPGVGWFWSPMGGFGSGGIGRWRGVTGVWMRSGGVVAIVPSHPLDVKGKPPINLSAGTFAVTTRGVSGRVAVENAAQWKVENKPSRDIMQNQLGEAAAPARVSRAMVASGGSLGVKVAGGARTSGIVYDSNKRKFVNADTPRSAERSAVENGETTKGTAAQAQSTAVATSADSNRLSGKDGQSATAAGARVAMPARATVPPPNVPRSVTNERVFNDGARSGGGANSRGSTGGGASGSASRASAPAAAPSSSGSTARSTGSSGGGRPH